MENIIHNTAPFEETVRITSVAGARVLSKQGFIIGTVKEVRIDPEKLLVGGIVIKRRLMKPLYIGRTYIEKISDRAVILNIEPSVLVRGKNVITHEGKTVGKVKEVSRMGETNEIKQIIVKSLWSTPYTVQAKDIKKIGKSVLLKESYEVKKRYFWQKEK